MRKTAVVIKSRQTKRQRITAWWYGRRLVNRFKTWYYRNEVMQLINLMADPKYPRTGISKEPRQLVTDLKVMGWSGKKASRVIRFAVRMGILVNQPIGKTDKKFIYQLNSAYLQ